MSKLELYKKLMSKAKTGGYKGPDYKYQLGYILDDTNIYSVIFREDFAKALWGEKGGLYRGADEANPFWKIHLSKLVVAEDKWKYLEEKTNFND